MLNIQETINNIYKMIATIIALMGFMAKQFMGVPFHKKYRMDYIAGGNDFEKAFDNFSSWWIEELNSILLKLRILGSHKIFCYEREFNKKLSFIQDSIITKIRQCGEYIMYYRFGYDKETNERLIKSHINVPLTINIDSYYYEDGRHTRLNNVPVKYVHRLELMPADLVGIELLGEPSRTYLVDGVKYFCYLEDRKEIRLEYQIKRELKIW